MLAASGCKGSPKADERVVAKIGSRSITVTEYSEAVKSMMPEGEKASKEEALELKKEVIGQMIEEALILEEAARKGITATDGELDTEVEKIKNEYGDKSFKDVVTERYGSMDEWRQDVRKKLIIKKTIEDALGKGVAVSDEAARKYYEGHIKEFEYPEQVRARQIVVASADGAQKLLSKLTKENFADTAKQSSLSPDGKNGGDLGFFGRGEMPSEFEDAVFKLKPGEISPVVKTEYGYHIFLLETKRQSGRLKFNEAKGKIMERLRGEGADRDLSLWISVLKEKAAIELHEELL